MQFNYSWLISLHLLNLTLNVTLCTARYNRRFGETYCILCRIKDKSSDRGEANIYKRELLVSGCVCVVPSYPENKMKYVPPKRYKTSTRLQGISLHSFYKM
jgi:hypothetical protein